MDAKDILRRPDPRRDVRVDLREVVLELHRKPHVLMRMRITGWHFPERAPEPFVLVGDVVSRLVRIAPDGLSADAYFDKHLPAAKGFSFGYGRTIEWDFDVEVDARHVERLDRARLQGEFVDPFHAG
jgi:hypothetical protein